jgi:hypothetical protein
MEPARLENIARIGAVVAVLAACPALAGEADVVDVKVRAAAPRVCDFDVTVRSVDKGWNYYADAFEVLAPDGRLLGRRELLHPHETEQPLPAICTACAFQRGVLRQGAHERHG